MRRIQSYFAEGLELACDLANDVSSELRGRPTPSGLLRSRDPRLEDLCGRLRQILLLTHEHDAAPALNGLITAAAAAPLLAADPDGTWHLHLHTTSADETERITVKAAAGLAGLMDDGEWNTIRVCGADRCDAIFIDHTRSRTKRYCSRVCANRVNARLSRDRARHGGPTGGEGETDITARHRPRTSEER